MGDEGRQPPVGAKETIIKLDPEVGKELDKKVLEANEIYYKKKSKLSATVRDFTQDTIDYLLDLEQKYNNGEISEDNLWTAIAGDNNENESLATSFTEVLQLGVALEKLQDEHKPYLVQELKQTAEDHLKRFDWDTFLQHYDSFIHESIFNNNRGQDSWSGGQLENALVTTAKLRRITLTSNEELMQEDYNKIYGQQTSIKTDSKEWQKRNFLKETGSTNIPQATQEQSRQKRLETKIMLQKEIIAMNQLVLMKKYFRNNQFPYENELIFHRQIDASLDFSNPNSRRSLTWADYEYDVNYLIAIENFLINKRNDLVAVEAYPAEEEVLQKRLKEMREVDVQKALSKIRMEGFEARENEELVISGDELKMEVAKLVPACFLNDIEVIISTERPVNLEDSTRDLGEFKGKYDQHGNLINAQIEIFIDPSVDKTMQAQEKYYKRSQIISTCIHEIGHGVQNRLTLEEMLDWYEITTNDQTNITWYVEYSRNKNLIKGFREDFCESYEELLTNPTGPIIDNPLRATYMYELTKKYMDAGQTFFFVETLKNKVNFEISNLKTNIAVFEEVATKLRATGDDPEKQESTIIRFRARLEKLENFLSEVLTDE